MAAVGTVVSVRRTCEGGRRDQRADSAVNRAQRPGGGSEGPASRRSRKPGRAVSRANGPASTGTTRTRRADSRWTSEVAIFLALKAGRDSIGDGWQHRMRYELERVPRLLGSLRQPIPTHAAAFGEEHLLAMRRGLPWEKATLALHFAALKQFLGWARNPIVQQKGLWRLPSGESGRRRWLTRDQLLALYTAAKGQERLLIALEGFNGLRRVEVLRLRFRDVLRAEDSLMVRGKGRFGGKWRKVPLHPRARDALGGRSTSAPPDDLLLPLSRSGADGLLHRAAQRAGFGGIGVKVSHHDLRRTFGRLAHEAGMDLVQLKNLFGHASIDMTVHYIGLDTERMREGLERLNRALGDDGTVK